MTHATGMIGAEPVSKGSSRRGALTAVLGGVLAASLAKQASAQVTSSPDTAQVQFALNLHYLLTNFLQVMIYGEGRQLPAALIRGGEGANSPGVSATSVKQIMFDVETRTIQARLNEIADEHWFRTELLRGILRADSPAQKLIDYSSTSFTTMFRLAGVIGQTETFDPYASPNNGLLAADTLLSVQASVLAGMLPNLTNDVVQATMVTMSATAASNATAVRYMIQQRAAQQPDLLVAVDKLAAWRDRVDGTATAERPLTPTVGSNGSAVTRIGQTNADGLYLTRTPQQALNVLFMTAGAVSQGGFFPTGINGIIGTSAAN
ncbi:ferritin-like domain-containing protein [Sphingomonas sp. LK11]|uniref:ferritin-like domain-containing protein n=1 Tax=Sphingomonas sp. LK11 TaxID=1390395 RepID=UPI0015614BC7|nr:ferritin-like domain-containing protein [Sphingomonas sp. LK11]